MWFDYYFPSSSTLTGWDDFARSPSVPEPKGASDLGAELVMKSSLSPNVLMEAVQLGIALLEGDSWWCSGVSTPRSSRQRRVPSSLKCFTTQCARYRRKSVPTCWSTRLRWLMEPKRMTKPIPATRSNWNAPQPDWTDSRPKQCRLVPRRLQFLFVIPQRYMEQTESTWKYFI